jgi:hypothetical protein
MYITYEEYTALYDPIEEKVFNQLVYDACRHIDRHTTGIDGVKKLKIAFPTDDDSVQAIKRCAARITNLLVQLMEAEKSASMGRGYAENGNTLQGKVVSSVTSGSESISYSMPKDASIDKAAADKGEASKLICATIRDYLSGVTDANGIYLLYMGRYPV